MKPALLFECEHLHEQQTCEEAKARGIHACDFRGHLVACCDICAKAASGSITAFAAPEGKYNFVTKGEA